MFTDDEKRIFLVAMSGERLIGSGCDKREHLIGICDSIERKVKFALWDERPVSYEDCCKAMMKMWIDSVITDGEYNRIMDKLNAKEMEVRDDIRRSDSLL